MPTIVRVDMDNELGVGNDGFSDAQRDDAGAKVGVGGTVDASGGDSVTESVGENEGDAASVASSRSPASSRGPASPRSPASSRDNGGDDEETTNF